MTDQMPMPQVPDVTPARTDVPPYGPDATPRRLGGRGALVALGVVAGLLVGAGVTWWAVAGGDDAMSHVEISGGKLAKERNDLLDEGENCDDRDKFEYNDCDASTTYSFDYEITNRGGEPANYTVIVNGFDDDGDFVGQAYVSSTHLGPGETDSAEGDFDEYVELADKHTLADIDSLRVAHVERLPLAN
jgi:hypothetical protein